MCIAMQTFVSIGQNTAELSPFSMETIGYPTVTITMLFSINPRIQTQQPPVNDICCTLYHCAIVTKLTELSCDTVPILPYSYSQTAMK